MSGWEISIAWGKILLSWPVSVDRRKLAADYCSREFPWKAKSNQWALSWSLYWTCNNQSQEIADCSNGPAPGRPYFRCYARDSKKWKDYKDLDQNGILIAVFGRPN